MTVTDQQMSVGSALSKCSLYKLKMHYFHVVTSKWTVFGSNIFNRCKSFNLTTFETYKKLFNYPNYIRHHWLSLKGGTNAFSNTFFCVLTPLNLWFYISAALWSMTTSISWQGVIDFLFCHITLHYIILYSTQVAHKRLLTEQLH